MTFDTGSSLRAGFAFRRPRQTDADFRRVFFDSPVASALVVPTGHFVEVNRGIEWLLGYPVEDMIGMTFADLAPPNETPIRLDELTREQQERCVVRADGEPVWVAVSAGVITEEDGRPKLHIVQMENIADRKRAERKLRRLADHDALTWLLNRRCFLEGVHRELQHVRTDRIGAALLLLDIDNLKVTNDTAGHQAGDDVLRETADVLRLRLRSTDVIGRLGGDEFAALLLEVTPEQAHAVAHDLTTMLDSAQIKASIGVAIVDDGSDETELLAQADRAMYEIKSSRR